MGSLAGGGGQRLLDTDPGATMEGVEQMVAAIQPIAREAVLLPPYGHYGSTMIPSRGPS